MTSVLLHASRPCVSYFRTRDDSTKLSIYKEGEKRDKYAAALQGTPRLRHELDRMTSPHARHKDGCLTVTAEQHKTVSEPKHPVRHPPQKADTMFRSSRKDLDRRCASCRTQLVQKAILRDPAAMAPRRMHARV